MIALNKTEFRRIYKQIVGSASTKADLRQLYSIICASGRNVLQSHLIATFPNDKQSVSLDRAYEIYTQLEGFDITLEDVQRIKQTNLSMEQILAAKPQSSLIDVEKVEQCLKSYLSNGTIQIEKFLNDVEKRKKDAVEKLLSQKDADDEKSLLSSSRSTVLTEERMKQIALEEDTNTVTSNGYLTVSPALVSTRFVISAIVPVTGEIHLKINRNSDISPDKFTNDIFASIVTAQNEARGITKLFVENDRYSTGPMTLSDGDVITVICLGTTVSQAQQDLKNPVEIVQENGKLTKRYKITLMNLFDAFDWDCDGYLNLQEMDAYTIMSGDEDGVKEDEWNMLKSEFDFAEEKMTIKGFIHMHEAEASSVTEDQSTLDDIWSSLERLGYNKQLRLIHGCPFSIQFRSTQNEQNSIVLKTDLKFMTKDDKIQILHMLYDMGEVTGNIDVRLLKTQYYGMLIAKYNEEMKDRVFRLQIDEEHNVKWNFVCGTKSFKLDEAEYMLIVSYTATEAEHSVLFKLVDDNEQIALRNI